MVVYKMNMYVHVYFLLYETGEQVTNKICYM